MEICLMHDHLDSCGWIFSLETWALHPILMTRIYVILVLCRLSFALLHWMSVLYLICTSEVTHNEGLSLLQVLCLNSGTHFITGWCISFSCTRSWRTSNLTILLMTKWLWIRKGNWIQSMTLWTFGIFQKVLRLRWKKKVFSIWSMWSTIVYIRWHDRVGHRHHTGGWLLAIMVWTVYKQAKCCLVLLASGAHWLPCCIHLTTSNARIFLIKWLIMEKEHIYLPIFV
jgi:hypothetical protein